MGEEKKGKEAGGKKGEVHQKEERRELEEVERHMVPRKPRGYGGYGTDNYRGHPLDHPHLPKKPEGEHPLKGAPPAVLKLLGRRYKYERAMVCDWWDLPVRRGEEEGGNNRRTRTIDFWSRKGWAPYAKYAVNYRGLGSMTRMLRIGGHLVAVCHHTKKTGYKAPNAYGANNPLLAKSLKDYEQERIHKIGDGTIKKLMKYSPNAIRNRPHPDKLNTIGLYSNPNRGKHTIDLTMKVMHNEKWWPPVTTSQAFSDLRCNPIGLGHPGIAARVARTLHLRHRTARYLRR
ncbi:hypothetical protein CBR_g54236 [Chara braunii]|uniref:Uncharacterized protein n=1 Tax=Chara braunii TaxID=69332 RepID=A0A388K7B0_CHABU|nr:hypothetical protein CBR_g54236 [Chara braunii]|eukprot:GBG65944.1 hypothetical protein CBR_g54236 [Chara braunii]